VHDFFFGREFKARTHYYYYYYFGLISMAFASYRGRKTNQSKSKHRTRRERRIIGNGRKLRERGGEAKTEGTKANPHRRGVAVLSFSSFFLLLLPILAT